jgi:hypothetical protein
MLGKTRDPLKTHRRGTGGHELGFEWKIQRGTYMSTTAWQVAVHARDLYLVMGFSGS